MFETMIKQNSSDELPHHRRESATSVASGSVRRTSTGTDGGTDLIGNPIGNAYWQIYPSSHMPR